MKNIWKKILFVVTFVIHFLETPLNKKPKMKPQIQQRPYYPFGLSNKEQDDILQASRLNSRQLPIPILIHRYKNPLCDDQSMPYHHVQSQLPENIITFISSHEINKRN